MDDDHIFLFDFDGTIADTFHHLVAIGNKLAGEFHFKAIRPEEIDRMKDMHVQEIIRHLGIPLLKVPAIAARAKLELHRQIASVKPVEGLKSVLGSLKNLGAQIGIITSNSSTNVQTFLANNGLDFFDFVHTTSKIWSKNHNINAVIHEHGFDQARVVYIGDETRDILAARKAGVRSIAVTWGYNSHKALAQLNPHRVIHKPEELLELCS